MAYMHRRDVGSYPLEVRLIGKAGLSGCPAIARTVGSLDDLPSLRERIRQILNIITTGERKLGHMVCFIMYDISSNKVRTLIAKYLLNKGCTRIQKSIFMVSMPSDKVGDIARRLAEIQKMYDNSDSILIVPLGEDDVRSMKIIGQEVDVDLVLHARNTLFF